MTTILVVLFVVIILLFILVFINIRRLNGGEYKQLTSIDNLFDTKITPSVSQIAIDKIKSNKTELTPDNILKESVQHMKDMETTTFNGFKCKITSENMNKYISDACMDALLLSDKCEDIYATNEFIVKDQSHGNNMITVITNKLDKYDDEYKKATTLLNGKKEGVNFIKQRNMNMFKTIKFNLSAKTVYNLHDNHFTYTHEGGNYNGKGTDGDKLFDIPIEGLPVFLEFVYSNINDIPKAYENIHKSTKAILETVFDRCLNDNVRFAAVRIFVKPNGDVLLPSNYEIKHNALLGNSSIDFNYVKASNTETDYKYDEYINLKYKDRRFAVQIEDSEGMQEHKSNLIEFILRQYKMDTINENIDSEIKEILAYFGYKTNDDDKYNFEDMSKKTKEKKEKRLSESSIIYQVYPEFWKLHNK